MLESRTVDSNSRKLCIPVFFHPLDPRRSFATLAVAGESPAYPGVPGHEPDAVLARKQTQSIGRAMDELRKPVPNAGSHVSEGAVRNACRKAVARAASQKRTHGPVTAAIAAATFETA